MAVMCDQRAQCEHCAKPSAGGVGPEHLSQRLCTPAGVEKGGTGGSPYQVGGAERSRSRRAATARGCRRQAASPVDQRAASTKGVEAEGNLHDGRRW